MDDRDPRGQGTVLALIRDLFFSVKIRNELAAIGITVRLVGNTDAFVSTARELNPVLGIIDISAGVDWGRIAELAGSIPLLAFGPHRDVQGFRAAKAAGVTRVVANSELHAHLLELVDRYARHDAP